MNRLAKFRRALVMLLVDELIVVAGLVIILQLLAAAAHAQCEGGICPVGSAYDNYHKPAPSSAQVPSVRWQDGRIVRVASPLGNDRIGVASGGIISIDGDASYVIHCAHMVGPVGKRITIETNAGSRIGAVVLAKDEIADVSILRTDRPANFSKCPYGPLQVATGEPPAGSPVTLYGFAEGVNYRARPGTIAAYHDDQNTFLVDGESYQGESGGPVVNADGQLVGVLGGMEGGRTWCCRLVRIRALVDRVRARMHGQRRIEISQQQPPTFEQPAATTPTPPAASLCDASVVARLEARIIVLEQRGAQKGDTGPPGPAWQPTEQDLERMADVFAARLKGITIKTTPDDPGQVVYPGEAYTLPSHATPVRVYLPDGTLAGESQTNIFRGESIDLTFNPRALLDSQ